MIGCENSDVNLLGICAVDLGLFEHHDYKIGKPASK